MGMGLLAAGALSGLGQAGMNIGQQMIKSGLDEQEREYILRRQQEFQIAQEERADARAADKRKAFVGELDKASTAKAAPDLANLSKAREIYSGLEGEDREAGLRAVDEAEGRVNADGRKLSGAEVAKAGLLSGAIDGKDYVGMLGRSDSASDKLANAIMLQTLKNDGRLENTVTREKMRDGRQKDEQDWKDRTGRGYPSQSKGGTGGDSKSSGNPLAQEKWDVAKTEKFIKSQPQFYMFKDELGKSVKNELAFGTFNSLAKILGGEKARTVMQQAFDNATADAEAGEGDFNKNYKSRLAAITQRLSGGK